MDERGLPQAAKTGITDDARGIAPPALAPRIVSSDRGITATIYFPQGKSLLDVKNAAAVADLKDQMQPLGHARVVVTGHASSEGSDSLNMQLSEQRRQAVIALLHADQSEVEIVGEALGESKPAVMEAGDARQVSAARQSNRRVEVFVTPIPRKLQLIPPVRAPKRPTDTELIEQILQLRVPPARHPTPEQMIREKVLGAAWDEVISPIADKLPIPSKYKEQLRAKAIEWAANQLWNELESGLATLGMDAESAKAVRKALEAAANR